MLPGLLAFALPFAPHEHPLPWMMLLHLTTLATLLTLAVILLFRTIARPDERHWLLNVISYPASIVLTLFLFPGFPEFAGVVLVILAFGDGSATLFGLLHGRSPLPWNSRKTWVGSLAFIACAAPLATLAYWEEARPTVSLGFAAAVGISTAIVADVAESLPLRMSDNLRVGIAALLGVVSAHTVVIGWQ